MKPLRRPKLRAAAWLLAWLTVLPLCAPELAAAPLTAADAVAPQRHQRPTWADRLVAALQRPASGAVPMVDGASPAGNKAFVVVAADPADDRAAVAAPPPSPGAPAADALARIGQTLVQAPAVVADATRQAGQAAWQATREVAGDLLPLGRPQPAASALALGPVRTGSERSLRIGELPGLLDVAAELPLTDKAGAAPAVSLQQAIMLGVANSLDVQAAGARRESFEQTAVAARGALLPRLDARAAVGTGRLDSVAPQQHLERKDGQVTLRQAVFDLPAQRESQRQTVLAESATLQWQAAVSSAGLQVASAYLQALQARLTIELGSDHERLLGELLTYIGRRAEAGGTSLAERDRVQARVSNARSQMADSRANLRAALRTLQTLIGTAPGRLALSVPAILGVPLTAEAALGEARIANRDLVATRTEAEAAGLEARGQRARFLPRVEVELSHSRAINAAGTESYSRDNKAMLTFNWSLLNGGTDLAQGRAAAARMREKQLRAEDIERKLDQDLEATYASLDSVGERYAALREELVANRRVVDAFQAQLVGGNRPLLDVLDAYQRLHQSRLDMAQLVIGEVGNHVKVAHLTGRLAHAGAGAQP